MALIDKFFKKRRLTNTRQLAAKATDAFTDAVKSTVSKTGVIEKTSWEGMKIGSMYTYRYDAKHKDTLPVFDRFPLTIKIESYRNGWLGLNLHYLPLQMRFNFLKMLLIFRRDGAGGDLTRDSRMESISYRALKATIPPAFWEPTIKRYLGDGKYMRSQAGLILPTQWSKIIFLPTAKWRKGDSSGKRPY